jgi:preprotein translocase subunit SecG
MISIFIIFLVLVCILLMGVVLMQSSKGSGLVGPIAGTGVTTMFGARRASDFLSKSTVVLAVIFMLSSLLINIYIAKAGGSEKVKESILQKNTKQLSPGTNPIQEPGNQPNNQQPDNQQPENQQNQNNQGEGNQQQNPAP